MNVIDQTIQIVGALLILAAFAGVQARRLQPTAWSYLWLNLVGSTALALDALVGGELGFLLLEAVWAAVTLWSMVVKARGVDPDGA